MTETNILICTDLDRTLLPNGSEPESPRARDRFARVASQPSVVLAYVSGRHRELVQEAIHHYGIPCPDWVIGDVGTTIYQVTPQGWHHWPQWQEEIAGDWRGSTATDVHSLLQHIEGLTLQEAAKQNRFKLSYYLPLDADVPRLLTEIRGCLSPHHLQCSLIVSVDEEAGKGLLDVLPRAANKLHAIHYLMRQQGFTRANTVFAGDSGNDLPVLVSPIPSVLVANAHKDVVQEAFDTAFQHHTLDAIYHARGGFMGMNGNYSAGILEGLHHYHPDAQIWTRIE